MNITSVYIDENKPFITQGKHSNRRSTTKKSQILYQANTMHICTHYTDLNFGSSYKPINGNLDNSYSQIPIPRGRLPSHVISFHSLNSEYNY